MPPNPGRSPTPDPQPSVVLLATDESTVRFWRDALAAGSLSLEVSRLADDLLLRIERIAPDVVIVEESVCGAELVDLRRRLEAVCPDTLLMVTTDSTGDAVNALRNGAYDRVSRVADGPDLALNRLLRAAERRAPRSGKAEPEGGAGSPGGEVAVMGSSRPIREVAQVVESTAGFDAAVLVSGELGTGKAQVARLIHELSARRDRPFVPVLCSSVPEGLFDEVFFGRPRRSGVTSPPPCGALEAAAGGTLFLEEVAVLPEPIQGRLHTALRDGKVRPFRGARSTPIDLRLVTSTRHDLGRAVERGRFREDLYYRINIVDIQLPPLRYRMEDLPLLAQHLLEKHAARFGRGLRRFSAQAMDLILRHPWAGNLRELERAIERAVVLERGEEITAASLPEELRQAGIGPEAGSEVSHANLTFARAKDMVVRAFEKRYLRRVLDRADNNISVAARAAGMDRANFRRLLKKNDVGVNVGKPT